MTALLLAIRGVLYGAAQGGAFTPLSLFASGEQGAWYDPSDLSSMNTLSDQTGTTPAVGDPVGYIADKSGNGNHATQATAAARPTLRQTVGGLYYLDFDGVDDFIRTGVSMLSGETWTYGFAYSPTGEDHIAVSSDSANQWSVVSQSGSTNTVISQNAVINSLYFDNVLSSATTRGDIYTEWEAAKSSFAEISPTTNWSQTRIGFYTANFGFVGFADLFGYVFINRSLTTDERNNLQSYSEAVTP